MCADSFLTNSPEDAHQTGKKTFGGDARPNVTIVAFQASVCYNDENENTYHFPIMFMRINAPTQFVLVALVSAILSSTLTYTSMTAAITEDAYAMPGDSAVGTNAEDYQLLTDLLPKVSGNAKARAVVQSALDLVGSGYTDPVQLGLMLEEVGFALIDMALSEQAPESKDSTGEEDKNSEDTGSTEDGGESFEDTDFMEQEGDMDGNAGDPFGWATMLPGQNPENTGFMGEDGAPSKTINFEVYQFLTDLLPKVSHDAYVSALVQSALDLVVNGYTDPVGLGIMLEEVGFALSNMLSK